MPARPRPDRSPYRRLLPAVLAAAAVCFGAVPASAAGTTPTPSPTPGTSLTTSTSTATPGPSAPGASASAGAPAASGAASPAATEPGVPATDAAAGALPPGVDTPELRRLRERAAETSAALIEGTRRYTAATARTAKLRAEATGLRADLVLARGRITSLRAEVDRYAAAAYRGVPSDLGLVLDLFDGGDPAQLAKGVDVVEKVRRSQNAALLRLVDAEAAVRALSGRADAAAAEASRQEKALAAEAARLREQSLRAADALAAQVAEVNAALQAAAAEARVRADDALGRWQAYLDRLRVAQVSPPPAASMFDPASLPAGLLPVMTGTPPRPTRGIAQTRDAAGAPLIVVSREAVATVTAALSRLGKPYVDGADGPDSYDCGGLTAAAWPAAELPDSPAGQWSRLVPVPAETAAPGDLVFLGDERVGVQHSGVSLGGGLMLAASRASRQVEVSVVPAAQVFGVARVPLGQRSPVTPPARDPGGVPLVCGAADYPSVGVGSWGGYANGLIPPAALCPLPGAPAHRLRCDAADAFAALGAAYAEDFGKPICLTDSYRTYQAQVAVYAVKPDLAAVPGTSNHGWALAIDFCGGIEGFGTPQHAWMQANAGRFGWVHPAWAEPTGSKPEPWHWEFGRIS